MSKQHHNQKKHYDTKKKPKQKQKNKTVTSADGIKRMIQSHCCGLVSYKDSGKLSLQRVRSCSFASPDGESGYDFDFYKDRSDPEHVYVSWSYSDAGRSFGGNPGSSGYYKMKEKDFDSLLSSI